MKWEDPREVAYSVLVGSVRHLNEIYHPHLELYPATIIGICIGYIWRVYSTVYIVWIVYNYSMVYMVIVTLLLFNLLVRCHCYCRQDGSIDNGAYPKSCNELIAVCKLCHDTAV